MTQASETKWYEVAEPTNIPLREGRRVRFKDYDVALFNLGESFKAIDNTCPHKQGPLADGIVTGDGDSVFCPLHNLKVNLGTGCSPSKEEGQVKTYPTKVHENKVYIAFEEGALQDCE